MGGNMRIFHTGRWTSVGERVADALSKGKFDEVRQDLPHGRYVSDRASKFLLNWSKSSKVGMALGRKGLLEVAAR